MRSPFSSGSRFGRIRARTRLLLAEDDPDQREVLVELLRSEGFEVAPVENGLDALLHLLTNPEKPEVVLLDLQMPIMDGREFLTRQLADPIARQVPVVVLSSERASELDVAASLEKPCPPDIIVWVLRTVVDRVRSNEMSRGG